MSISFRDDWMSDNKMGESKKSPWGDLTFFIYHFFHKRLRIFNRFLHTYYTFLSTLDYKFLFDYPRF